MSQRRPGTPSDGDVGYARDTIPAHIAANRSQFLCEAGFDATALTLGRQVHGDGVAVPGIEDRGRGQPPEFDAIPATDGLLTNRRDIAPGIIVADCVPVLLYDPVEHAVAVVHAGWRGTVAGIVQRAVERMTAEFGSAPEHIHAGIGPSIGLCCYEVGHEVIDAWMERGATAGETAWQDRQPRPYFDLWKANRMLLETAGIAPDHIEVAGICTRCCDQHYFSHRAAMAGERPRGRMIMIAQLT